MRSLEYLSDKFNVDRICALFRHETKTWRYDYVWRIKVFKINTAAVIRIQVFWVVTSRLFLTATGVVASIIRISTDNEWGVCSWLWHLFVAGKAELPVLVASARCVPFKNTLDWSAVVSCSCEVARPFSVVFNAVRAVHKFYLRLVTNETPNILWQVNRRSCSKTETCF